MGTRRPIPLKWSLRSSQLVRLHDRIEQMIRSGFESQTHVQKVTALTGRGFFCRLRSYSLPPFRGWLGLACQDLPSYARSLHTVCIGGDPVRCTILAWQAA